jgi:hypothetical protein
MKKTIILLTIIAVLGVGSYAVFAKGHMGRGMQSSCTMDSNDMMMQKGMMGQHGMMGMHPMSGMMCGSSLVATEDGNVIVLMGNKLLKYDKDLNLVKEVEIKIDWENWKKTMKQHHNMMMGEQKKTK